AADLPVATYTKAPVMMPAMYDWSGFYLGVNGGGGSAHKCGDRNPAIGGTFFAAEGCHNATGGIAGGQIGYRFQNSAWVWGFEAQGDWANLSGSNLSLLGAGPAGPGVFPAGPTDQSRVNA